MLKTITDFFIWLLFITTALATVILIGINIYYAITENTWNAYLPLLAAIITALMHAGLRYMPQRGRA